ncbi:MAG TPA: triple tyrosine motif-containing protein [Saprospiraceae bacterium]|nr:triple tyrosine motif-containing protein [Saprospiraceae bacterium]HMQ85441.1 triple tyrosine motif-containing protein [Saprospiraceae bacterium]
MPWLDNYMPAEYKNHGKIWQIASANNGIVYFAGDEGLLEYDGQSWNQYKGSKGNTRALWLANDSLIYSGSDLDFGVWTKNKLQQFEYASLYPFGKDIDEVVEEFWHVYGVNDKVIFISFNNIYIYKNKQLTKIAAPYRFSGCFQPQEGGDIYLADEKNGLYLFNGLSLKPIFTYPDTSSFQISGIYQQANGLVVVTRNDGLYRYQFGQLLPVFSDISKHLTKDKVFSFSPIDDTHLAFGTIHNGLYITDLDGRIVQHINKEKGLPNNTILSLHHNRQGVLWLSMDYGITAVHLGSNLTYLFDHPGQFGTGQTALLDDGLFYLGTNQGLYVIDWNMIKNNAKATYFELLPGSAGQVWTLEKVGSKILCGHDRGLFQVQGKRLLQLYDEPGVWEIQVIDEGHLLTGNYNGVSLFHKEKDNWVFEKKMEPLSGSCDQLKITDKQTLWVNLPNFGIIKATFDGQYNVTDQQIFPSDWFEGKQHKLYVDATGVHVLTSESQYTYRPTALQFEKQQHRLPSHRIKDVLPGFYTPIALNDTFAFYPIYNGFALQNIGYVNPSLQHPSLLFRNAEAFNNHTRQAVVSGDPIPYRLNNWRIQYLIPQQKQVQYRYKLEHYTTDWSNWTTATTAEFLNLKEGEYTFWVSAKIQDEMTVPQSFKFKIEPPWYRTWMAYTGYALLLLLLVGLIHWRQGYKLAQQRRLLLEKEQESLRQQAEKYQQEHLVIKQMELEDEIHQLKKQLRLKTIELAKKAKDSEDKKRLLQALKEKIKQIENNASRIRWTEINHLLESSMEKEDPLFELQMDELHQDFLMHLKSVYPDLTTYDLRLCTYLKTGLNSKEIAEILNVLPSSVNVSRSRLRKKFNLGTEDSLYEFLNQIR